MTPCCATAAAHDIMTVHDIMDCSRPGLDYLLYIVSDHMSRSKSGLALLAM